MFPQPTPPPLPQTTVGSSTKAPAWLCGCGRNNLPVQVNRGLLASRYKCESCDRPGTHDFDVSLVDLRVNGIQVMPPVRDQGREQTCAIHAPLAAVEILVRRQWADFGLVFNKTLQWEDVRTKYELLKGCVFDSDGQTDKCFGRLEGILDVLKNSGVVDQDGTLHRIKSYSWRDFSAVSFADVCSLLVEGFPVLTVVPFYPHMLNLKENDVYSIKGYPTTGLVDYHVIVLISGLRESGKEIFRFLDSHSDRYQVKGIGKIEVEACGLGYGLITL